MEFKDVLISDFFTNSLPSENHWRIFLEDVPGNVEPFPKFSADKHNIFVTELKLLYTAITRARSRVSFRNISIPLMINESLSFGFLKLIARSAILCSSTGQRKIWQLRIHLELLFCLDK